MFKKIAIAAALAILSSSAMADDQPYFYAGGDIGRTDIKYTLGETSYGGFAGYQINQTFGVELAYRRLAHSSDAIFDAKMNHASISGTATLPLDGGFSVYGRFGYGRASTKFTSGIYSGSQSKSSALFGVGFNYAITPAVSARIELQRVGSDTNNLSTGISYRF